MIIGASPIYSLMRNVIIPPIVKVFVLSLKMQTFDICRLANCESAAATRPSTLPLQQQNDKLVLKSCLVV